MMPLYLRPLVAHDLHEWWRPPRGSPLASHLVMSDEKSTEEQNVKIDAIVGDEVLGYDGPARGEHSGQDAAGGEDRVANGLNETLADNRPEQLK